MNKQVNEQNQDLNDLPLAPLQAEKGEWILTPDGQLHKSAATKKHSKMRPDEVTDKLPIGSYIFSDDKDMTLYKKDFEDFKIGEELIHYEEGFKSRAPKDIYFTNVFKTKKKATPAQIAKNIANENPILAAREHNYNPFIKRANKLNKENRAKSLMILKGLNDMKKDQLEQEQMMEQQMMLPAQFRYGGLNRSIYPYKYGAGGDIFGGAASGAAAGAAFGPIGAGVGAGVGAIGSWLVGRGKDKEAKRREAERQAFLEKIRGYNDQGYFANNAATFAKSAIPLPEYEFLDLSDPINRTTNTYNKLQTSENARRTAGLNNAQSMGNSTLRNVQGLGLNPTQVSNLVNNATGQGINASNQSNMRYDTYYDNMDLNKTNSLNKFDSVLAQDKQRGINLTNDRRYNKNMNTVGEFGNNFQKYNQDRIGTEGLDMQTKLNLAAANAQERAQSVGRFQNTLMSAGPGISQGLNNFELRKHMGDYYDALKGANYGFPASSNAADILGNANNISSSTQQYPGVGMSNDRLADYMGLDNNFSLEDDRVSPFQIKEVFGQKYIYSPSRRQWVPMN